MSSATRSAISGVSSTRIANSSPPSRATVSPVRTLSWIRRPTSHSSSSPTGCPRVSLTNLKSSRSATSTATEVELRWRSCIACSRRSENSARLGRPVRGSRNAMSATVSSSCRFSSRRVNWRSSAAETRTRPGDEDRARSRVPPQVDAAERDGERHWQVGQPRLQARRPRVRFVVDRRQRPRRQRGNPDDAHRGRPGNHHAVARIAGVADQVAVHAVGDPDDDHPGEQQRGRRPSPPSRLGEHHRDHRHHGEVGERVGRRHHEHDSPVAVVVVERVQAERPRDEEDRGRDDDAVEEHPDPGAATGRRREDRRSARADRQQEIEGVGRGGEGRPLADHDEVVGPDEVAHHPPGEPDRASTARRCVGRP